jgi:hypothetical protein
LHHHRGENVASRYGESYGKLLAWVHNSLDLYKVIANAFALTTFDSLASINEIPQLNDWLKQKML